jgi:3'-phosphoadenosine 5'-phosphosulfate sulfotransferase (PAPS reductase)/FAD synthetase
MRALAFSGGKDSLACLFLLRDELDCAIYVDTGFAYPETRELVQFAAALVPMFTVQSDRRTQNDRVGLPADVVPIDWTVPGQAMTSTKPVLVQSYLQCCYENIARPLLDKAHALGVTHLVYGQRASESHRGTAHHGQVVEGITRLHPIDDWTTQHVLDYLALHMPIPEHFSLTHSSLDCYDCTAFKQESQDRLLWTQHAHPDFYEAYELRAQQLGQSIYEALHV